MRLKPWQFLVLLAAAIALLTYCIDRFRHRYVSGAADLVRLLPEQSNATTFYVQVALLRSAHLLSLVSAPKTQEPGYRDFVHATGFDYARDLDAIAGSITGSESDFALLGRFDWSRIRQYVLGHGGVCAAACNLPTSTPGKRASLRLLQTNVLTITVGTENSGTSRLSPTRNRASLPADPVWLILPSTALRNTTDWPLPAQLLAGSVRAAQMVTFSAGLHDGALRLRMKARFESERSAQLVRNQLEIDTKMLKLELAREHNKPNPADLTGLLTAGTFAMEGGEVIGDWPIDPQLLRALEID